MVERLKWKRASIEGWFVAHPIEGDTMTVARIFKMSGRPQDQPSWGWNLSTAGHKVVNGDAFTKQEAADAANEAWHKALAEKAP